MVPEKQKGHVYYRCTNTTCTTKTIREERLEEAALAKLSLLQLSPTQAATLKKEWIKRLSNGEADAVERGLELRISECKARMDRLTDLLIDGVLGNNDFDQRKRTLTLELAQLEENLADARRNTITEHDIDSFLDHMKSLATLYKASLDDEKRQLLENAFSKRTVTEDRVHFEVAPWITEGTAGSGLPTREHIACATIIRTGTKQEEANQR